MKLTNTKIIGGLAIGYILFLYLRKKKGLIGNVNGYQYQTNTPSNAEQVFSKVGTKIYDNNGGLIYTYNTACIGMTMTGQKDDMFSVVIGESFMNGIAGFVNKNDVIKGI
jgi:hypothetical protein